MNEVVAVQIGRPLRSSVEVVSTCHLELPVVVRVPPRLDDGSPFPTLYWLTCPLARARVGRMEAGGGVKRMEQKARSEASFGEALQSAHLQYAAEREVLDFEAEGPRATGGVGGARTGVKCLHAHYAHTRAGGDNPVGNIVAAWVEPLDCQVPCVVEGGVNPAWSATP
jgi:uncharacterized protein